MRHWGFSDAQKTRRGSDNGIDATAGRALGQVKYVASQVGRPDLQRLFGARGIGDQQLFFFTGTGYSKPARDYADEVGMRLFAYQVSGTMEPVNGHAHRFLADTKEQQEHLPRLPIAVDLQSPSSTRHSSDEHVNPGGQPRPLRPRQRRGPDGIPRLLPIPSDETRAGTPHDQADVPNRTSRRRKPPRSPWSCLQREHQHHWAFRVTMCVLFTLFPWVTMFEVDARIVFYPFGPIGDLLVAAAVTGLCWRNAYKFIKWPCREFSYAERFSWRTAKVTTVSIWVVSLLLTLLPMASVAGDDLTFRLSFPAVATVSVASWWAAVAIPQFTWWDLRSGA
ncbi:restriction endonuclease [Salininema proteolyticum]